MCAFHGLRHFSELTHRDLAVKYSIRDLERDRVMYVVPGIAPDSRTLMVNDSSIHTLYSALTKRLFYCDVNGKFVEPPQPAVKTVFRVLKKFRTELLRSYGSRPSRISPEQFVEMYTGRKRTIYENAATEFHLNGVRRMDAVSVTFVKMEKVNPFKAPRAINPRTPVYNLALGTYLKPIEKMIYRAIRRASGSCIPVVMKGYNVVDVGSLLHEKWKVFANPVAVGLDATKFDMHVSSAMLKWEHSIYLDLFAHDAELAKLLTWQVDNRGRGYAFDGKLSFKVKGRRFSGDMNTAMGNCLIMSAMVITYCREKGIKMELANNGDDCVVFMEREDLPSFSTNLREWFIDLGFRLTVETAVDVLEHVEFCQMHPVCVNDVWTMVRNFHSSREKDSIAMLDISKPSSYAKWLGAVGECGLALNSGVPVLQQLYITMGRHGTGGKMRDALQMQSGAQFLRMGLEAKVERICASTRLSFYLAFDITPDEQVALEEYYAKLDMRFGGVQACGNQYEVTTAPF